MLALDRGDLWYRHVVRRQLKRAQAGRAHRRARRRLPRDRRARPRRAAARAARRQRAGARALDARRRLPARSAGRPTGPRRPAPARPGCCTATTTTCPRSAGGRRTRGRAIVTNHPRDAAEIERRRSDGRGLLHADGASRANILSGDAPHSMLTMSTVLDRKRPGRLGQDYFAYFASPYGVARTLLRVDRRGLRRALRRRSSRSAATCARASSAAGSYALVRAYATVDPARPAGRGGHRRRARRAAGRSTRRSSPTTRSRTTRASSGRTRSRCCGASTGRSTRIAAAVEHAPRPYRLVVLSDHGQSQGATFRQRYGEALEDIVGRHAGDGEVRAEDARQRRGPAPRFNAGVASSPRRDTPRRPRRCARRPASGCDEPAPTDEHPRGLGDGLGQPRAHLVPARAGPRHARADRGAPARAARRAAHASRASASCSCAPSADGAVVLGAARPAPAARRHASRARTRSRRSARSPPTTCAAPTASRTARTSSSTAPTGRSWRRSRPSRSSSARTAGWAAARRTRSCCTRRTCRGPTGPVVGARGRAPHPARLARAARARTPTPSGARASATRRAASVATRVAAPARDL